jgi:DNA-binding transcriptional MerR regulator
MSLVNETPTFNLKAVVQETGLKPDTLRAWERRYGLPQPERTPGGHRIYSQHDIDTLKWLIERQDEGLSISRAVALWQDLAIEGRNPLIEYGDPEVDGAVPPPLEVGETLVQLRDNWIGACLEYDEKKAEYVLAQAFAVYPPETVCLEILQKGLAEIGMLWYEREATAQQEHFASALAIRRLEALIAAAPAPTRTGRLLVGCPPLEEHVFSPLLLTLLLRRRGWEVVYLGANVPLDRMERTIAINKPRLAILTAQTLFTAATLMQMAELLHADEVPVAYGGLVFITIPEITERIPGHFLGSTLRQAPHIIEQILASPTLVDAIKKPAPDYMTSLYEFRENQAQIEAGMWRMMNNGRLTQDELWRANYNLARDINAALTLGDMSYLSYDLEWLQGLMTNHNYTVDKKLLQAYLQAYYQSTRATLGADSDNAVLIWLEKLMAAADE